MGLKELAKKLPQPLEQAVRYAYGAIPIGVRLGERYRRTRAFLRESQWWSREQLEEYQRGQLHALLNHAYENVPYYRKVFLDRGLLPTDIRGGEDLCHLPFLTKAVIRENFDELVATNLPKKRRRYVTTGGTTGIPFGFFHDAELGEPRERAFMNMQWNRIGFEDGQRRVLLRGNVVRGSERGRLWQYNPIENTLIMSVYHMDDDTLGAYVDRVRRFRPLAIHAYPSAVTILAKYILSHGITDLPPLKAVLCGSENVYEHQNELIEKAFDCRVFSWYGHSEMVVMAGECEHSSSYHVFPEYGVLELVDEAGSVLRGPGKRGEIVGTGFNNFVMPLIRYKTEDWAEYDVGECACGRNYPRLKTVEGRWLQETIVGPKGNLISVTALNMHGDTFDHVEQFQFYQDTRGKVVLNVVKKATYNSSNSQQIIAQLREKMGQDMDIEVRFVDTIPRTTSGKWRFLIQKLPIDGDGFD